MDFILKKDLTEISNSADNIKNSIDDFTESLCSILEDLNDSFKERYLELHNSKEEVINKINNNPNFSFNVKDRLKNQLEYIINELEEENFYLDVSISEDDIVSNFCEDSRKFLEHNFDIDDHLNFIDNFFNEIENRISTISKFSNYSKSKHKFVIEKRNGIIAIKDKYHPDYLSNKDLDININNPEVIFLQEGINDLQHGWIIPDSIIENFKILKRKINSLLN